MEDKDDEVFWLVMMQQKSHNYNYNSGPVAWRLTEEEAKIAQKVFEALPFKPACEFYTWPCSNSDPEAIMQRYNAYHDRAPGHHSMSCNGNGCPGCMDA